jgi:hypothetical protein
MKITILTLTLASGIINYFMPIVIIGFLAIYGFINGISET